MDIPDDTFDRMIQQAMNELPREYIENLDNVAIVYADDPTPDQLTQQGVRHGQLLLGLFEGIPQTQRGVGYTFALPDKITIFKHPLVAISRDEADLRERIKRTLWHEIAHHYGLNHRGIDSREERNQKESHE